MKIYFKSPVVPANTTVPVALYIITTIDVQYFTERLALILVYKVADLLLILWRIRSQSALKWIINLSVCTRVKSLVAQPCVPSDLLLFFITAL